MVQIEPSDQCVPEQLFVNVVVLSTTNHSTGISL